MAKPSQQLVICLDNENYPASLETRKIYVSKPDAQIEKSGFIRITDESGEDYLYPKSLFKAVTLSRSLKKAVLAA